MPVASQRKIIHIDMDCFFAAIEIRDQPALAKYPVAVGGDADKRGVICTCNYRAREYGVRSAMATATAYRLCPSLILLPVNMSKYRQSARMIHQIFKEFTDTVEPAGLDEAYLDVTGVTDYQGSATRMAEAMRKKIFDSEKLTASAGVAPNKLLAKIASGWKKPNGLFVIRPEAVSDFMRTLPVGELQGVGKVTAEKLYRLGLRTCVDLQQLSMEALTALFGKFGADLYEQARGIDERPVAVDWIRKSLSVEETFPADLRDFDDIFPVLQALHARLLVRLRHAGSDYVIKGQKLKIKFSDFKVITIEWLSMAPHFAAYVDALKMVCEKEKKFIRLIGLGVRFRDEQQPVLLTQQTIEI